VARPRPPSSVAVLYFDNLSRDTADAFLAEGITEELMGRLAEVRRLDVKPRSLSQRVREMPPADPPAVGRQTGAAFLVTGSVRRAGTRVRVTVELTRAATRRRVWTRTLDASGGDVLAIEETIARDVVRGIVGELLPAERAALAHRPTRDDRAYELYLRARSLANRFTELDLRAAVALYEQAISRDSLFAPAWIGLGQAWSILADDFVTPREADGHAERAFARALAIDTSALALAGMTVATLALDYGLRRAEPLARRALELEPSLADARIAAVFVATVRGDLEQAVEHARVATIRDSLSLFVNGVAMQMLLLARRYDELMASLPRALLAMPASEVGGFEGAVRFSRGDCGGAVPLLDGARQLFIRFYVVPALVCVGRRADAQLVRESLLAAREHRYVAPSLIATVHAALGDLDEAFRWLDRAYDERDFFPLGLHSLPPFAPLRSDPRWAAYRRRIGMEP
jgi:TolB-like protein